MDDKYILKDRQAVPASLEEWAKWFQTADRTVAKAEVGEAQVSTVFLGLNHNWGDGPPLLFETMIFGGEHDKYQDRCSTWEEAEQMHAKAVALATQ